MNYRFAQKLMQLEWWGHPNPFSWLKKIEPYILSGGGDIKTLRFSLAPGRLITSHLVKLSSSNIYFKKQLEKKKTQHKIAVPSD